MFYSMKHDPWFLEIGNSTLKLARRCPDGMFDITRFSSVDELLRQRDDVDRPILCAPVGRTMSSELLERFSSDRRRTITHDNLRRFIGHSYDTPETLGLDLVFTWKAVVLATAAGLLAAAALTAAALPAWRAARLDPVAALREE